MEYVTVGFEEDSIGTIADRNGRFMLEVPANRRDGLVFSHVSYLASVIPYQTYSTSGELKVVLKDKEVALTEVVIGKSNKPKSISGKSLSGHCR